MALSLTSRRPLIGVAPGTWVDPDTLQGERNGAALSRLGFDLVIPEQSLGQWTYFSSLITIEPLLRSLA